MDWIDFDSGLALIIIIVITIIYAVWNKKRIDKNSEIGMHWEDVPHPTRIGLVSLEMNREALKERIGKSKVKQEKLLNLLCDNNFIIYYRNNNQDHLNNNPFMENFLAASREIKGGKTLLLSTGIEIIVPILSFENESNKYFVFIRDELMRE